jgi:hypothetical protein
MRHAIALALSAAIAASLVTVYVNNVTRRAEAVTGYATRSQVSQIHVARPSGMRNLPEGLVSLP